MSKPPAIALENDYYVANFETLAGFVVETYSDLLSSDELSWNQRVASLSDGARRLYIRLLMRRGSIYRVSRLNYEEISDIAQAADELAACALGSMQPPETLKLALKVFTKAELVQLLELDECRNLARVPLIDYILSGEEQSKAKYLESLCRADSWLRIAGHQHWALMQLCFFGNLYQDSSEFVLRDLGTVQYEQYPLEQHARAFSSRAQIDAHLRYFECEALFGCLDRRDTEALMGLAAALPQTQVQTQNQTQTDDFHLVRRVDRLRNHIARQLERLGQPQEALELYSLSTHPPARERRVRVHLSLGQWALANKVLQQMQYQPFNESEATTTSSLLVQCQKLQGLRPGARRVFKPATSTVVLRNTEGRVEELARTFYARQGPCFHAENALVNGVLGLFIWDILFHPVPGVFFNPFQSAPSDFYHAQFCQRRASLLAPRFEQLTDAAQLKERVLPAFTKHYGKLNPLVRWHRLSTELLNLAIERIPTAHWQALFARVLSDTRENTTGLPDLVLFAQAGGYEFIEIKGPGDTLQANQRRWMQYFDQQGISYRLVRVRYRVSEPAVNLAGKALY